MGEREEDRQKVEELLAGFAAAIREGKARDRLERGASDLDGLRIDGVLIAGDPEPINPPEM